MSHQKNNNNNNKRETEAFFWKVTHTSNGSLTDGLTLHSLLSWKNVQLELQLISKKKEKEKIFSMDILSTNFMFPKSWLCS
jgi:hypothetical protein